MICDVKYPPAMKWVTRVETHRTKEDPEVQNITTCWIFLSKQTGWEWSDVSRAMPAICETATKTWREKKKRIRMEAFCVTSP